MGIKIAVHDNEEAKKVVNLINKSSMGQYRRWKREHAIQALQDKTLNKKPEVRMTERHENKNRAHSVVQIVDEILGFGGPPKQLHLVDSIGRALGNAGFHVTIRPERDGSWAELIAKATAAKASIFLEVFPQQNVIVLRNFQYYVMSDRDVLMKGLHNIRIMAPMTTKFVPNYEAIGQRGDNVLQSFKREIPNSLWVEHTESAKIITALEHGKVAGFKTPTAREIWREQHAQSIPKNPWVRNLHGQHQSKTTHTVHPNDVIGGDYPPKFHEWAFGEYPPDVLSKLTAEEQNTLYKHWISIGQPAVGQAHHAQPQSHAGYALDPHDAQDRYTGPRRGFGHEQTPNANYYNQGFDPWSTMQNQHSDTSHDPWHSSRSVETGQHVGYTPVQDIGGGRVRPTMPTPGEGHPGTYQAHLAPTAEYPEPQSPDRPGVADPRLSAPDPAQQTGRIPQSEKTHRILGGQQWGVQHPAVRKIVAGLHGLGNIHVRDKAKLGIYITSNDFSISIHQPTRGGKSKGFSVYNGVVVFYSVNPHAAQHFFGLLPNLVFRNEAPTRAMPIYWKNDFTPLFQYLNIHAPELLPELANALKRLPGTSAKADKPGNVNTGNILRTIRKGKP